MSKTAASPSVITEFHARREQLREARDRWRAAITPALDSWYASRVGAHDPYTTRDLYTFADFQETAERDGRMVATVRCFNDATFSVTLDAAGGRITVAYGNELLECIDAASASTNRHTSATLKGKSKGAYTPAYDLIARLDEWEKSVLQ